MGRVANNTALQAIRPAWPSNPVDNPRRMSLCFVFVPTECFQTIHFSYEESFLLRIHKIGYCQSLDGRLINIARYQYLTYTSLSTALLPIKVNEKLSRTLNSIRVHRRPTNFSIGNSFTSNKFLQPASLVQHLLATIQIRLALHPSGALGTRNLSQ